MLYTDKSILPIDDYRVQKNIDLEDIVNNHASYNGVPYKNPVPLMFSVSIRSLYDNTVVELEREDKSLYYLTIADVPKVIHKGYDLIMYLGSLCMQNCINKRADGYSLPKFNDIMLKCSQFMPMGLYASQYFDPIIYSHILISDDGMRELIPMFNSDIKVVPIQSMKRQGNLRPLLDTLLVVKPKSEESNNDNDHH